MIRVAFCVGQYPEPERQRRIDTAKSYESADVEIGILDIPASPYTSHGLTPAEIQMIHPLLHKLYVQAEREGYDAVVPLGTLDLGIDGGRSLVDIPVIGPTHAALHVAAMVGERFGFICYQADSIPKHRAMIRAYGMEQFIGGFRTVNMPNTEMAATPEKLAESFVREARSLIDEDGVDVIIPQGISQCPVHIKPDWLMKELGVPVVEAIGAPIRMAAMLAGLGVSQSRVRWAKSGMKL